MSEPSKQPAQRSQPQGGDVSSVTPDSRAWKLARDFIAFLETGEPPEGLFAPHVFCDFTLPL